MVADTRFIDLDHLTHRFLVTHRLLLQCMKKPSVLKERKILDVIEPTNMFRLILTLPLAITSGRGVQIAARRSIRGCAVQVKAFAADRNVDRYLQCRAHLAS